MVEQLIENNMSNQITTATNLQGSNVSRPIEDTQRYFNNFYSVDLSVGNSNDSIVAFFQKYTGSTEAGKNLAASVIYTAKANGMDPLEVMSDFQRLPSNQLDAYLVAFLNSNRVPTSVLGIKTQSTKNEYVTRSILV
jgi:hypothetical protein